MTVIVIGYSIRFHTFSNNLTMQLLGRYSLVSGHWWLLTVILLLLLLILSMYFTFDWISIWKFVVYFDHIVFLQAKITRWRSFLFHIVLVVSTAHSRILVCSTETYTRFTRQHRVISNKFKNNKIKYQVAFVNFSFSFSLL
jgi:membrane protein implicated in regulation of membrane protease activity